MRNDVYIYNFLVPQSLLNLKEQLIHNGYELEAQEHLAKFYYLLHKLRIEAVFNKAYKYGGFVELHSKIMDRLLGQHYYKNILNILERFGIIEIDPSYQVGRYCKGYRLIQPYLLEPAYWVGDNSRFSKKLKRWKEDEINQHLNRQEFKVIFNNLKSIQWDYQLVNQYLRELIQRINPSTSLSLYQSNLMFCDLSQKENMNQLMALSKQVNYHYLKNKYQKQSQKLKQIKSTSSLSSYLGNLMFCISEDSSLNLLHKFNSEVIAIANILKFNNTNKYEGVHFTIDQKGNRLHNNITNLSKRLRSCLIFEETNQLVNVDLHCCQPLLLALLVQESLGEQYKYSKETQKYLGICLNNDPYVYLMKKSGFKGSEQEVEVARKSFKEKFYSNILFGKVRPNKLNQLFEKEFGEVYRWVQHFKKDDYKNLSIQLQRMESNLIFNGVVPALLRKKPDLYFLTIHDSILCKREDDELVKATMEEVIYQHYRVKVQVKLDRYNHSEWTVNQNEILKDVSPELQKEYEVFFRLDRFKQEEKRRAEREKKETEEFNELWVEAGMEILL